MYYTIYKITNTINNKFYIGKHQTKNLDDGYMGSGKLIRQAIVKYGIENFSKEILHIFDNKEEMNAKEKELVIISEDSYNLCPGGHGGWGYVNANGYRSSGHTPEMYEKIAEKARKRKNPLFAERTKIRHKLGLVKYDTFTGKHHTEETKHKISQTRKANGVGVGEKNSQYGKPRSEETKEKIRQTLLKRKQENKDVTPL